MTPPRPSAPFFVGDDGVVTWSERHADAWIGLLETHKRLTRTLDAELDARYGLTLSSLELLARLAAAPDRCLRLSGLASAARRSAAASGTWPCRRRSSESSSDAT